MYTYVRVRVRKHVWICIWTFIFTCTTFWDIPFISSIKTHSIFYHSLNHPFPFEKKYNYNLIILFGPVILYRSRSRICYLLSIFFALSFLSLPFFAWLVSFLGGVGGTVSFISTATSTSSLLLFSFSALSWLSTVKPTARKHVRHLKKMVRFYYIDIETIQLIRSTLSEHSCHILRYSLVQRWIHILLCWLFI